MRKSTKIFLIVGLVPAIFITISYVIKCSTSSCVGPENSQAFLIVGIVLIASIFVASICASAYNFVYDRLGTRGSPDAANSSLGFGLKRGLLPLFILGVVAVALLFGYSAIQDKLTKKTSTDLEIQKSMCAKSVESQTVGSKKCTETDSVPGGVCTRVDVNEGLAKNESNWVAYYVDSQLYENCLKNLPAR